MENDRKYEYLIAVIITLFAAIAFYSVGNHGFTYYDDWEYVKDNYYVRQGLTWASVKWAFEMHGYAANWHPLTWMSHMIDVDICGLRAECHHTTSLLIHIINANLLFFTLRLITRNTWPSAVVAAIFAVHPLRIESVAWISERKDVLCGFFWILTIYAYGCYAKKQNIARYIAVLFFYGASLMSKAMAVTLPFVLILIDYWPLKRLNVWGLESRSHSDNTGKLILEKCPLLFLSFIASAITFYLQSSMGAVHPIDNITLWERVGNTLIAYVLYLWKMIWPVELSIFYPFPDKVSYVKALFAASSIILVTILVIMNLRKRPYLMMGWFYYLGTMIPVIGLVQVGNQSMADRYTYMPSIGVTIMVVWWLFDIMDRRKILTYTMAVVFTSIVTILCICTQVQLEYWKDNVSLFKRSLEISPDSNAMAHYTLGILLPKQQQTKEAIYHTEEAIRLDRKNANAYSNLASIMIEEGKEREALLYINETLKIKPDHVEALNNLGYLRARQGDVKGAISLFRRVLEIKPHYVDAKYNLAWALYKDGNKEKAEALLRSNLEYENEDGKSLNLLGVIKYKDGRVDEAVRYFQRAVESDPSDKESLKNSGLLFRRLGMSDLAIIIFKQLIEIEPKNISHKNILAEEYIKCGQYEAAEKQYIAILKIDPQNEQAKRAIAKIRSKNSKSKLPQSDR